MAKRLSYIRLVEQHSSMSSASRYFPPIDFKIRFPALDGIRALAVTAVFARHYGGGAHSGRVLNIYNELRLRGAIGVDLFFVLSGFLICGILYDTRNDSRFFQRFFARRSVRIFPVFYLVVAVLLLLTPVLQYEWRWGQLPFLIYMGNLLACLDPSLYRVVSANHPGAFANLGHIWSLCVEEQFYLLWPFVVWMVRDRVRLLWIAAGLCLLALALRGGILMFVPSHLSNEIIFYTLPCRMDAMLFGSMLALLLRGESADRWQRSCKWIFLVTAALVITLFTLSPADDSPWLQTIGLTLIAAASAGLIGSTLRTGSTAFRLFHLRPLRILGKYSYGFYIFHAVWPIVWGSLDKGLSMRLHSSALGGILADVIYFALTFGVAKLSYDMFEVRFLSWKRRFEYDSELKEHKHAFMLK